MDRSAEHAQTYSRGALFAPTCSPLSNNRLFGFHYRRNAGNTIQRYLLPCVHTGHTRAHRIISPPVVVQPQLEFSSNGDSRSWRVKRAAKRIDHIRSGDNHAAMFQNNLDTAYKLHRGIIPSYKFRSVGKGIK